MKPSRLLSASITLALVFLFTFSFVTAIAAPEPIVKHVLIKSVSVKASTVEILFERSGTVHTYIIDGATSIIVNGNKAKIANIKIGMIVANVIERDDKYLDGLILGNTPQAAKPNLNVLGGGPSSLDHSDHSSMP